jgi:hypothetical protein
MLLYFLVRVCSTRFVYSIRNAILGESIILIDQSMILSMADIDKTSHSESQTLLNAFQSFAVSQSEL